MIFFPDIIDTSREIEFLYNENYVEKKFIEKINIIAEKFNLKHSVIKVDYVDINIKRNYTHSSIIANFINDVDEEKKFSVSFTFPILKPLSNGSYYTKGYERNIIKALDFVLWKNIKNILRMHLLNFSLDPYIEAKNNFRFTSKYRGSNAFIFLQILYYSFPELQHKYKDVLEDLKIPYDENKVKEYLKMISVRKSFNMFNVLYYISDIVKLYSNDPIDFFLKSLYLSVVEDICDDGKTGLNVLHKRVVTDLEILLNLALKDIIEYIVKNKKNITVRNRNKKISNFNIFNEPVSYAYEYIQLAENFFSPIFSISNRNRVIITGRQSLLQTKQEDVRDVLRDIHDSQYSIIDPITTTDKDKTGTNLFLASSLLLEDGIDEYGRFKILLEEEEKRLNYLFEKGYNIIKNNQPFVWE